MSPSNFTGKSNLSCKVIAHHSSQKDKRLPITFAQLHATTATLKRLSRLLVLDTKVREVVSGRESIFTEIPVLALS